MKKSILGSVDLGLKKVGAVINIFALVAILFSPFLVNVPIAAAADTVIFTENFEQSGNAIANSWRTASGSDAPGSDTRISSTDDSWGGVEVSGKALLIEGAAGGNPDEGVERDISTHGYATLKIQYSRALNGVESDDLFVAQYSLDDGAFTNLETLNADQVHAVSPVFTISNPDRHTKLTLRFYINGSNDNDEVGIDNLTVSGDNAPIFYDGFESDNFTTGGWNISSSPDVTTTVYWTDDNTSTAGHSAHFDGGGSDDTILKAQSTVGYKNIRVRFARDIDNMGSGEYFRGQYSTDGGSNWTNLESTDNESFASVLPGVANPLPAAADNNSSFQVRFQTNGNDSGDDAYFDDVVIWGEVAATSTVTVDKVTVPSADPQVFNFTLTGPNNATTSLTDTQTPVALTGLSAGDYTLIETPVSDWTLSSASCSVATTPSSTGVMFTVGEGASVSCTFNNTKLGSITVYKNVISPSEADVSDDHSFTATLDGSNPQSISENASYTYSNLLPGDYTIGEEVDGDYDFMSFSADAEPETSGAQVTVVAGTDLALTITNKQKSGRLMITKNVTNHGIGSSTASEFTISVTGSNASPASFPASEVATEVTLDPGAYSVGESGPSGYAMSQTAGCSGTIAPNQTVNCTVTNSDIPTGQGAITIIKNVTNDNGGTLGPNDFTLQVTPEGGSVQTVVSGEAGFFATGTYTISEASSTGYTQTGLSCTNGSESNSGTFTLDEQEAYVCTITNDDNVPSLTLTKVVSNPFGGSATAADWTLSATSSEASTLSGVGPTVSSDSEFEAGTYTLSEAPTSETSTITQGYGASDWVCVGGTQGDGNHVTIALGESVTCTITNTRLSGSLRVTKVVVGGTASSSAFSVHVKQDGDEIEGSPAAGDSEGTLYSNLLTGSYAVSETGGPANYNSSFSGSCDESGNVAVASGETANCVLTNTFDEPEPETPTPPSGGGGGGGSFVLVPSSNPGGTTGAGATGGTTGGTTGGGQTGGGTTGGGTTGGNETGGAGVTGEGNVPGGLAGGPQNPGGNVGGGNVGGGNIGGGNVGGAAGVIGGGVAEVGGGLAEGTGGVPTSTQLANLASSTEQVSLLASILDTLGGNMNLLILLIAIFGILGLIYYFSRD